MLKELGVSIIPASAPDFFTEDTPSAPGARGYRSMSAVAKLAAPRKQKRKLQGRCEGRKPLGR
jgi:hypothetical protein